MGIGAKLELLLQEHHMNANELAKKIDVAPTTIYSMIKRDSRKADIEVLLKISKELGVTTEYFCDDEFLTSDSKKEPSYENLKTLIARNGKEMSIEEKLELIKMLSEL